MSMILENTTFAYSVEAQNKKEKILRFWNQLFPTKDTEFIANMLKTISNVDIEVLLNDYVANESNYQNVDFLYDNECFDSHLNEMLEGIFNSIYKTNRWIYFFKPILNKHVEELLFIVKNSCLIKEESTFLHEIIQNVVSRFTSMSFRLLVVETNIAKHENRLIGNNSNERSEYYSQKLLRDTQYINELYRAYPVLGDELDRMFKNTVNYIAEIIKNTEDNLLQIEQSILAGGTLGELKKIVLGNGDTHNNGRTVATLVFENAKIMYKPRSFSSEKAFDAFTDWVNNTIPGISPLKTAKSYSTQKVGWMEFVKHDECDSSEDVYEFYLKMGQLLCILFTLNSKDCHCENIIASGKYPILIDLETLLHTEDIKNDDTFDSIEEYISHYLQNSVNEVLILPSILHNHKTNEAMEIGAIGSGRKRVSPFKSQIITGYDSDEIQIEQVNKVIEDAQNYPLLNGESIGGNGYIKAVMEGFKAVYQWVIDNNAVYVKKLNDIFKGVESRVILKGTNDYTQLLTTSYHPDLLHNTTDRFVYFHRLGILISDIDNFQEQLIYQSEIKAMLNGDIPIFTIEADSLDVHDSSGSIVYRKVNTILSMINRKIESMCELDLERQMAIINMSYIGCKMEIDIPKGTESTFNYPVNSGQQNLMDMAGEIANKVIERSLSTEVKNINERSWICYTGLGDDYYTINPVGWDMYKGNSGVAIFIGQYALYNQDNQYKQYTKEILNATRRSLLCSQETDDAIIGFGAFTGMLSYVHAILHMHKIGIITVAEQRVMVDDISSILRRLTTYLDNISDLDVLSGLAGILGTLVRIYESDIELNREEIKVLMNSVAQRLKEKAITIDEQQVTWTQNHDIGYAHGNSGIMSQMARANIYLADDKIESIIQKALNYERQSCFDAVEKRWDFRDNAQYFSWCNGIGGLLLSKLILLRIGFIDEKLKEEINMIIAQLKVCGLRQDSSICHGDMGTISILREAARFLKDSETVVECKNAMNSFVESYLVQLSNQIYCIEDWGVMVGKSGIGLALIDEYYEDNSVFNLLSLS